MTQLAKCHGLVSETRRMLRATSWSCAKRWPGSAFRWRSTPTATPSSTRARSHICASSRCRSSWRLSANRLSSAGFSMSWGFSSSMLCRPRQRAASSACGGLFRPAWPGSCVGRAPQMVTNPPRPPAASGHATTDALWSALNNLRKHGSDLAPVTAWMSSFVSSTGALCSTTTQCESAGTLSICLLRSATPTPASTSMSASMGRSPFTSTATASQRKSWPSRSALTAPAAIQTSPTSRRRPNSQPNPRPGKARGSRRRVILGNKPSEPWLKPRHHPHDDKIAFQLPRRNRSSSTRWGEAKRGDRERRPPDSCLRLEDRADLHGSDLRHRALRRVGDSLVQVLGLDHIEADELVAGLVERARRRLGVAIADANGFRGPRGLHGAAGLEHALAVDLGEVVVGAVVLPIQGGRARGGHPRLLGIEKVQVLHG